MTLTLDSTAVETAAAAPTTEPDPNDGLTRAVAGWVKNAYMAPRSDTLVGMLSSESAIVNSAKTVLGTYSQMPKFRELLDRIDTDHGTELSVVEGALRHLASGEFAARIERHNAQKHSLDG